ncbi:MAG: Flp pilus assembly complex ATPase component TadA [Myxococcales bacterium]|nr:Flp pilus assembly complex ATPase component TadA [Myxococcales bacterium]
MAPIPASLLGLFGPVRDLLVDPTVRRVLVDGPDRLYVQRAGPPEPLQVRWPAPDLLKALTELAARAAKPFDEDSPCLEAMLKDGTRFLALRAPVVKEGPVLVIARPAPTRGAGGILAAHPAVRETLATAMRAGLNVGVAGPPGPARDALLQVLVGMLSPVARVVVIDEDDALALGARPLIRLTPRRGDGQSRRGVSVGDLVYSAGRLDPDRVIINQLRAHDGWEALALLSGRAAPVLIALAGRDAAGGLAWLAGLAAVGAGGGRDRGIPGLLAAGLDLVVTVDAGFTPRVVGVDAVSAELEGPVLEALHVLQPNGTFTTEPAHGRWAVRWSRFAEPDDGEGEEDGLEAVTPPPVDAFSAALAVLEAPTTDEDDREHAGAWEMPEPERDDVEVLDRSMMGAIREALAAVVEEPAPARVAVPGARPLTASDAPRILSSARIELPDSRPPRAAFPTVDTASDLGIDSLGDADDGDPSVEIDVVVPRPADPDMETTQALDLLGDLGAGDLPPDPELEERTVERSSPPDPLSRLLASLGGSVDMGATGEIEAALDGMEDDDEEEETVIQRPAEKGKRTFSEILRSLGRPAEEAPPAKPARRGNRTTVVREED